VTTIDAEPAELAESFFKRCFSGPYFHVANLPTGSRRNEDSEDHEEAATESRLSQTRRATTAGAASRPA